MTYFASSSIRLLLIVLTSVLLTAGLSACGGTTYHYSDEGSDHGHIDPPYLTDFHIVDTYGTNTEFEPGLELALSPYANLGEFEVYWNVVGDEDYFVELRFNDVPSTSGSRLISSDLCGPGLYCHSHQYQYCDYSSDFYIDCENASGDWQGDYIGDWVHSIPQYAYLVLQVCDTSFFYCESEIREVVVE